MSALNVQEFAVNLHDALAILAVVALIGAVLMLVARLTSTVAGFRFLDVLHRIQLPLAAIVANGQACLRFLRHDDPDLDDVRGGTIGAVRNGLLRVIDEVFSCARSTVRSPAPTVA